VKEAITSGMVAFYHMPGEINPSDVLSKHWGHAELWLRVKALLFWRKSPVMGGRMDAPEISHSAQAHNSRSQYMKTIIDFIRLIRQAFAHNDGYRAVLPTLYQYIDRYESRCTI
jgi:hypothetical protein